MIFSTPKPGIPQHYQGRGITLASTLRQASNDWLYREGWSHCPGADAIVVSGKPKIDAASLLVALGFCSSRKDFERTVKNKGIKYCGMVLQNNMEIDCESPSCHMEFRRGPLFLEIVVPAKPTLFEWYCFLFKRMVKKTPGEIIL
jgi:hypothetical protein